MSIKRALTTGKPGNRRWIIAAVFFLAYMVAFFDSSNVAILIADNHFTGVFGITADKSAQGLLLTAFLLCFGVACFFTGHLVQRFGPGKTLGWGLLFWAVLMAVMGSISSFVVLLICRALLGAGEAILGPSVNKLMQAWFPAHERAKANGIWFIGIQTAQMTTMPLVTWVVIFYGWRESFYLFAAAGLIPIIFSFIFVHDSPSQDTKISREEVEYISGGIKEMKLAEETAGGFTFLKTSSFWLAVIIYCGINAGYWGFIGWVPTYLKTALGFSFSRMGIIAALPYIGGIIAVVLMTPIMDRSNSRAAFTVAGCLGFGTLLLIAMFISNPTAAVVVLCLANVFIVPVFPALFTILQNTVKPNEVAVAAGFFTGIAYMFASTLPYILGTLYNFTGNLKTGFYVLAAIMAAATLAGISLMKRHL